MKKKLRLTLVIDASVARAAGKTDAHQSRHCRAFLQWVLRYCHRLALTADIDNEWKTHQSKFTTTWRVAMEQRGKIRHLGDVDCGRLQNRIRALNLPRQSEKEAMAKDALLIVAAQAADRVIVSLDDAARALFEEHAGELRTPRGIDWQNPTAAPKAAAPADKL